MNETIRCHCERLQGAKQSHEHSGLLRSLCSLAMTFFLVFFCSCARKGMETAAPKPAVAPETYAGEVYKVGVILPLTGKYAAYGSSVLNGIECAAGIFSPCESNSKLDLIIKDDAGEAELSATAVEELVNKDKVSIILGPLSSSSVESAALKAKELNVPLISLSQKEGVAQTGENIFSVAMTANVQVSAIIDYAVKKKKLKNFAIVYPTTPYGEKYKELFETYVKDAGAKVVISKGYGETTQDFGGLFRTNVKSFDALFIPDSYRAVGYIANVMTLEGHKNVQLLGINRWNNPELVERGGDAVNGAVFVDGFFAESNNSSSARFASSFKQAYDMDATILEAIGFDAARIASAALRATGGAHAKDVLGYLLKLPDVEGSVGSIGFDSNREAIRKLFFLTVNDGKIKELLH